MSRATAAIDTPSSNRNNGSSSRTIDNTCVVVGGGPAGLMAAEVLARAGVQVDLYDAMPSVGRKFLLAGKGGLNLTHAECADAFASHYRGCRSHIEPMLQRFGATELRAWVHGLGLTTFVGSSGRIFPTDMKAAPLLRAWLHRLRLLGVRFHMRHRWLGWAEGGSAASAAHALRFDTPHGALTVTADTVLLALGGASWQRLGSDGAWVPWLCARGVDVATLAPSNCGFDVARAMSGVPIAAGWSDHFRVRHAGAPVKNLALRCGNPRGSAVDHAFAQAGEFIVTDGGVEGSLIYAASAWLRDTIAADGHATAQLDLLPQRSAEWIAREVAHPRGSRSLATHLKTRLGIDGVKGALLHELLPREVINDPVRLAVAIKALPLRLSAPRPIDEAISSAGGVRFEATDSHGELHAQPGVFCAGEMLDWEAPTGGYLLTACMASGVWAGEGVLRRLRK